MEKSKTVRLATACSNENCCPVADFDPEKNTVTIHDPHDPLRGSFVMLKPEWDILIDSIKK